MTGEMENYDDDFLEDFVIEEDEDFLEPVEGEKVLDAGSGDAKAETEDEDEDGAFVLEEDEAPESVGDDVFAEEEGSADEPTVEEDLLFADHTEGVEASEVFENSRVFDEDAEVEWNGDGFDLDTEAADGPRPEAEEATEFDLDLDLADAPSAETEPNLLDMEAAEEGPGPLEADDEFAIDGEEELQIVDDTGKLVTSLDEGGDFDAIVLAEEGEISEACDAEAPLESGEEGTEAEVSEEEEPATEFIGELSESVGGEADETVEGWEPLPGTGVDSLAEVEDVTPVEDGEAWEEQEYAEKEGEPDFGEEHDIYAEAEEEAEVVGTYQGRGRMFSFYVGAAAAVLLIGGISVALLRPEWIGWVERPAAIEVLQVKRPTVRVAVGEPPVPSVETPKVARTDIERPEPIAVPVEEPAPVELPPVALDEPEVEPQEPVDVPEPARLPVAAGGPEAEPETGDAGISPVAETEPDLGWPVAAAPEQDGGAKVSSAVDEPLLPAGDGLLVGSVEPMPEMEAMDGVTPGLRAFAQLHNGNYFIGSVKAVNGEFLTLRMEHGEVSLPRDQLAKVAELGSADYEALQKVTTGFIRLNNHNRLVGGILRSIADDHVILETRRNRVMLPRSAIGEIVEGESVGDVRIGTTVAEDEWLRALSVQQLKDGDPRAVAPQRASPTPSGEGDGGR